MEGLQSTAVPGLVSLGTPNLSVQLLPWWWRCYRNASWEVVTETGNSLYLHKCITSKYSFLATVHPNLSWHINVVVLGWHFSILPSSWIRGSELAHFQTDGNFLISLRMCQYPTGNSLNRVLIHSQYKGAKIYVHESESRINTLQYLHTAGATGDYWLGGWGLWRGPGQELQQETRAGQGQQVNIGIFCTFCILVFTFRFLNLLHPKFS